GRLFHHAGHTFNVVGLTDEAGTRVEAYEYDPYGAHTRISDGPDGDSAVNWTADDTRTASAKSAFGATALYTGQRWDAETGLHYYKRRYYDDGLGRFVSRDPIGTWGDYLAMGNGYGYASSIPTVRVDTLGLETTSINDDDIAEMIDPLSTCKSCIDQAMQKPYIKSVIKIFTDEDCNIPNIKCNEKCPCDKNGNSPYGMYHPNSGSISLCVAKNVKGGCSGREKTIYHELVHALDHCQSSNKKNPFGDCNDLACTEIRAYYYSDCGHLGSLEQRKKCIAKAAADSVAGSSSKCAQKARDYVAQNLERCLPKGPLLPGQTFPPKKEK
ncbi:MAG: RHS repeat-associated core domain-containing protein, partial [Sumerlaeia bacterium]